MAVQTLTAYKSPELSFVPARLKEEFVDYILEAYRNSGYPLLFTNRKEQNRCFPDVVQEIFQYSHNVYVMSALVQETGDPDAYEKHLATLSALEEKEEWTTGLFDEYLGRAYSSWMDEYIEDIIHVCNLLQLSYILTQWSPFNPSELVSFDIFNNPIVEVW